MNASVGTVVITATISTFVHLAEDRAHRVVLRNQDVTLDTGLGNYALMIT